MIFRQLKYLLRAAGHNLWNFRGRNLISILIISFSFLVIGVFLALSNNLTYLGQQLSNNLAISFFLKQNLPAKEVEEIKNTIMDSTLIESVIYVSQEEALSRFTANFPELQEIVTNLDSNPFPPSLEARLKDKSISLSAITAFIDHVKRQPGVIDVQFNQDWVQKMESLSRIVKAVGFFLGAILILASFFIISNVVRLNVFARKNEIEIQRLVGATNTFIRIPFLVEGFILGLAGSLLSILILFLLIKIFPLYIGQALGAAEQLLALRPLTLKQMFWLVVGGALTGTLGSVTSVSRFLRV
ncbi:MAG TPA: permease-like cell division protein FtsX [Candidatus Saccharicenans sp.]|nr:permease-like cell division protein FtsX [Candidatus Saccharicenans sp.]HOT68746.1 permease-like cell division protein FtsX [Candidatus Saccharicenans sp.]HPC87932.1 permease-like cell division protein FtsX [Candidatus Saccharicenans sp.]HQE64218.1 permease-like cell division protein FtsX [Candidatus Saccharicenans sp.]HQH60793.1 permease-like cell division protein FtsX [Candidatus Saccharicenans sp.]